METTKIEFTRVNNDSNGNPRYVCHFSELLNDSDKWTLPEGKDNHEWVDIHTQYQRALKKARAIGGRKFHNKQYGGGIVFQSYNIGETEKDILELRNK